MCYLPGQCLRYLRPLWHPSWSWCQIEKRGFEWNQWTCWALNGQLYVHTKDLRRYGRALSLHKQIWWNVGQENEYAKSGLWPNWKLEKLSWFTKGKDDVIDIE